MIEFARRHKAWLTAALTLVIFVVALMVLRKMLAHLRWSDVMDELSRTSSRKVMLAAMCSLGSYMALMFYDGLALRIVGRKIGALRVAMTSFIAYGVGHSVGLSSISGGSVRLRMYSAAGLSPLEIAAVIALCSITFVLGVSTLMGLSLILKADVATTVLHIPGYAAQGLGLLILLGVGGYLGFTAGRGSPVTLRGISFSLPPLPLSLAQLSVSCVDLSCAAATLYFLLPHQLHYTFPAFVGLYVLAIAAGVASNVPGGLGVFESVMLLMLPNVPKDKLLGAVLLYRVLYYLVPFFLSLLLLAWSEWRTQSKSPEKAQVLGDTGKVVSLPPRKTRRY